MHPKLLLFPIFSGLAFIATARDDCRLGVCGCQNRLHPAPWRERPHDAPLIYAAFFAFYFACTFMIVFFNAALVFCALESSAGKKLSLRTGLATAAGRLPQILAWTFVATTIGVILSVLKNFLKDRLGFLGALLGGVGELAWSATTYFVVPVLVVDGVRPIEAVKRSSSILRRTWGEAAIGEGGLGVISVLLVIPVVLVMGLVAAAGADTATAVAFAAVVPYVLALMVVFTALGTIFRTGVYIFATTGNAPSCMDPVLLQAAFRKGSP